MALLILDPSTEETLIADRHHRGIDRWDEVWNGVYRIVPPPDNQHQWLVGQIGGILHDLVDRSGRGTVYLGCNVSDRGEDWTHNYRCPDLAVYLNDNPAADLGTHWEGGPDLAIEIVRPGDASHDKLDFYSAVGTRELQILDRDPWRLELYRAVEGRLSLVSADEPVQTQTVALEWLLVETAEGAATLKLVDRAGGREWSITG